MNYFNKSEYVYMSLFVSVCEYVCMRGGMRVCVCVSYMELLFQREKS